MWQGIFFCVSSSSSIEFEGNKNYLRNLIGFYIVVVQETDDFSRNKDKRCASYKVTEEQIYIQRLYIERSSSAFHFMPIEIEINGTRVNKTDCYVWGILLP